MSTIIAKQFFKVNVPFSLSGAMHENLEGCLFSKFGIVSLLYSVILVGV